jgi:hypothetical protein
MHRTTSSANAFHLTFRHCFNFKSTVIWQIFNFFYFTSLASLNKFLSYSIIMKIRILLKDIYIICKIKIAIQIDKKYSNKLIKILHCCILHIILICEVIYKFVVVAIIAVSNDNILSYF